LQGKSWVQVGVASWSTTCPGPGRPSTFVKTAFHREWISKGTLLRISVWTKWFDMF